MLSMPFNSSTAVMYYNKDAFRKAGLDPEKPPVTWPEVFEAAKKLKASGMEGGFTTNWITWIQLEKLLGLAQPDARHQGQRLRRPRHRARVQLPAAPQAPETLYDLQKDKVFVYGGRANTGEGRFTSGECPILFDFVGGYGNVKANCQVRVRRRAAALLSRRGRRAAELHHRRRQPVGHGRQERRPEYKAVAKFFTFLSDTDRAGRLHQKSGYLPITKAAYEMTKASGYYKENPDLETPLLELTNKEPTENSRGLRLGNMVQLRDVWAEEFEAALSGKKSAKQALDDAVARGNQMLRQFERTVSR